MSVKIMAWVWDHGPTDGTETLVLLALADFSDDTGRCYPSMRRIADKARMQERSAQRVIRRLEAAGWIAVSTGNGRHGCNQYRIVTEKGDRASGLNAEKTPTIGHPDRGSPRPSVQKPRPTRQETPTGGSPEPSGTIINRQQQPREAKVTDDDPTRRERLLAAMCADPVSGIIGPNGTRLGSIADMEEADRWGTMGLSLDDQCRLIAERMEAQRRSNPAFTARSFRYFTAMMADFVARRSAPVPTGQTQPRATSDEDRNMAFLRRVAGQGGAT